MGTKYRFSLKSEELRGAQQPNILYMELASDADAVIFAGNLEAIFAADVVTVDVQLAENFSLPYPAGTNTEFRMVFRDATGIVQTERLYNIVGGTSAEDFSASLVAEAKQLIIPKSVGGVVIPGGLITSCEIAVFNPQQSY